MIPAAVGFYLLFIGLAVWGSILSFRLRQRDNRLFVKRHHLFILLTFAYAAVNFVGEVVAPVAIHGPSETLVTIYMIIDLITIPLLGVLFYLLFSWIARLLDRKIGTGLKAAFWGTEALYLSAFVVSFVSYFVRGITAVTYAAVVILNGVLLLMLLAAILALCLIVPESGDPIRRRLARGLGIRYAGVSILLAAVLFASRLSPFGTTTAGRILPSGLIFLANFPALVYLRRALTTWALPPVAALAIPAGWEGEAGAAGLTEREKEIARLVARGLDTREIAKTLFISPKTVKNNLTGIYAKTGARNRVQLANRLWGESGRARPESNKED